MSGDEQGANRESRITAIDELLAQTQCQACGYPACRPYAEAIVDGDGIDNGVENV
jgi:Na+-translocating ferredoxin:NAD+ oxidoreductase RNF subunit RnfB